MAKAKTPPTEYSTGWLGQLDFRTALGQELRNRYRSLTNDLGGASNLSYQQRSLVSRALWLEVFLEQEERNLANGKDFDSGRWTQAVNSLQGLYSKLGLTRQAKEVTLKEFMKKGEQP